MTPNTQTTADPPDENSPRSDLTDAALWLLLGAAILVGAWRMDRLENQDVPPFGAPGLLPGLLGLALIAFGSILLARSIDRQARAPDHHRQSLLGPAPARALGVIALCTLFGTALVGHGLPFWAAATLFVAAAILFLQTAPQGRRLQPRAVLAAIAIGLAAGLGITLVFQQIFLVRLP